MTDAEHILTTSLTTLFESTLAMAPLRISVINNVIQLNQEQGSAHFFLTQKFVSVIPSFVLFLTIVTI